MWNKKVIVKYLNIISDTDFQKKKKIAKQQI